MFSRHRRRSKVEYTSKGKVCSFQSTPWDIQHHSLHKMSSVPNSSSEVAVAIYDLSQGMARGLSAQFLGPEFAIDLIPHSGLIVYGREYFFGAGIQSESPDIFRQMTGMTPIQIIPIGATTVSRGNFEDWCRRNQQNGRFSPEGYDLLNNNCNHFAHIAALEGLGLSQGVPEWVLQVPQRFLSSPMGQMVRPMLEQMQLRAPVQGAHTITDTSERHLSTFAASTQTSPSNNPWAKIPSKEIQPASYPVLDSLSNPLLSTDSKTIPLCMTKIKAALEGRIESKEFLQRCEGLLVGTSRDARLTCAEECRLDQILGDCLLEQKAAAFVLMLLRLLVVQTKNLDNFRTCLDWIYSSIMIESQSKLATSVKIMGWLVGSNVVGAKGFWESESEQSAMAQAVLSALSDPSSNIRQAAAAFTYNLALNPSLSLDYELSDTQVSLLCGSLESIAEEPDATAQLRRLMTIGRLLVPVSGKNGAYNKAAINLLVELGMDEQITLIAKESTTFPDTDASNDANKKRQLALEISRLLASNCKQR